VKNFKWTCWKKASFLNNTFTPSKRCFEKLFWEGEQDENINSFVVFIGWQKLNIIWLVNRPIRFSFPHTKFSLGVGIFHADWIVPSPNDGLCGLRKCLLCWVCDQIGGSAHDKNINEFKLGVYGKWFSRSQPLIPQGDRWRGKVQCQTQDVKREDMLAACGNTKQVEKEYKAKHTQGK